MKATTPRGFSADTEILTRRGWLGFDQVTYLDAVATRTPEGKFLWRHPERLTWERYDGDLIWFHSRTANLMAAPETPILHLFVPRATANGKRYELPPVERTRAASSLTNWHGSLVATSTWNPDSPRSEFILTGTQARTYGTRYLPLRQFQASSPDFAAFMGMYLAEGNLGIGGRQGYDVWIWQKHQGRGFSEFQDLLNRIAGRPLPHNPKKGCWHFCNKGLYQFLKTCGGYAWTKVIPPEILDLPPGSLEQFWRYYSLGDGTVMNHPDGSRKPLDVISTTSKVMAGQFQEILQKLGGWALIQVIDYSKYQSKLGKTSRLTYRLVRRAGATAYATYVEHVSYSGMLGHAETGIGPVYVRREGRPVWAGL